MLLVSENDVVEVSVHYKEENGLLKFDDDGDSCETFTFRRPSWVDMRNINSGSIVVDPTTGKPTLDLYRYMDMKIKTLLKDWSIKNEKGEKLPTTASNINKLHPDLIQSVFTKMEEALGSTIEK